uniref:ADP-dependent glucokinase n=1 Tax=Timema genevievae TaxID=629358 RepID=A0A7R9K2W1_TIMGE|nr:unnamed protein product [Timema genevievae]
MASTFVKTCTVVSFFIVFVALYSRKQLDDVLKNRLNSILEGLVKVEKEHSIISKKVAIGYGACLDLFVDGKDLLNYEAVADFPEHFNDISSSDELLKSYAYFYRHGAAAERYMSNSTLFEELVLSAAKSHTSHYALGGNAPVMASRFVSEGCHVLLAAKMTTDLQKTLPEGITACERAIPTQRPSHVCEKRVSFTRYNEHSAVSVSFLDWNRYFFIQWSVGTFSKDDIHLILEYKAGEQWGPYVAPRANRFIVHNDANNPMITSLEKFDEALSRFNPNLLVVGGLQMMDSYPFEEGVREARLRKVTRQMKSQPPSAGVHFEMASFAEAEMLVELVRHIIPFADSLGMNEQELTNLHSTLVYGNISIVSDSIPRVAIVLDQMRQVFGLIREKSAMTSDSRQLTRLHVHTLAYQAIMTVKGSRWKNSMAAAAKASLTANRHVCGSREVDIAKATLIMDESFSTSIGAGSRRVPLNEEQPVSCWDEGEMEICVAPVLVCTEARQTAGGGDNISSAGLVMQI